MNFFLQRLTLVGAFLLTSLFSSSQCCQFLLNLDDAYGDGWNGASLTVFVNGVFLSEHSAVGSGNTDTLIVCPGDELDLFYTPGDYENENSYQLFDTGVNTLFADGPDPAVGEVLFISLKLTSHFSGK